VGQLIDTSIFIGIERRGMTPRDVALVGAAEETAALPAITASEPLIGVHRADSEDRRVRREVFVEGVLEAFQIMPFDLRVARVHARLWAGLLWAGLLSRGQMIGESDLLIAATALAHSCAVLTENVRDFGRVPELVVRQPRWPA